MNHIDLSVWREPEQLLAMLEEVRRLDRRDLRDEVVALLNHEDPVVREEALSLLLVTWRERLARPVALKALESPAEDFGVRGLAAIGLASTSSPATRSEDIKTLLGRALDRTEDSGVRRAAYEALLLMHGRPPPPTNRPFSVDADADSQWLAELHHHHFKAGGQATRRGHDP